MEEDRPNERGADHPSETRDDVPDGIIDLQFSTVRAQRLKMFSDAVWSIIATLMIAPSMHYVADEIQKPNLNAEKITLIVLKRIGFYFLAFLIVCSIWASHVWTFQTMEMVTDLSIVLNLAVLLAGSLLPYFYTLMTRFMAWETVLIYAAIHVVISLLLTSLIQHAFSYDGGQTLRRRIKSMAPEARDEKRRKILVRVWIAPAFATMAVPLSLAANVAATVCLSFILVFPWIQSFLVWIATKIYKLRGSAKGRTRRLLEREVILTERIRKGRIEAFNDGVFAIVSTLLVLDITEKYLPTKDKMQQNFHGNTIRCLSTHWGVYLSYMMTFILIGLLWDAQLTLFKNLNKISRLMLLINQWSVACVGVIPLAFTFIIHYDVPDAIRGGVRIGCLAVFLVGVWNWILYLVALGFANNQPNELWVHRNIRPGGSEFVVVMMELSASPICSAIVFSLTFLDNQLISAYVGAALIVTYALFLIFWKTLNSAFCHSSEYEILPGRVVSRAGD